MTDTKQTMRERRLAIQRIFVGGSVRVFVALLIAVFGVLYVMQTSSVSTKGYEINELQREITALERETERLEYEIAAERSMHRIEDRLAKLNLVEAADVEYVTLAGTTVARR